MTGGSLLKNYAQFFPFFIIIIIIVIIFCYAGLDLTVKCSEILSEIVATVNQEEGLPIASAHIHSTGSDCDRFSRRWGFLQRK